MKGVSYKWTEHLRLLSNDRNVKVALFVRHADRLIAETMNYLIKKKITRGYFHEKGSAR